VAAMDEIHLLAGPSQLGRIPRPGPRAVSPVGTSQSWHTDLEAEESRL
jgi:hypothetical protein